MKASVFSEYGPPDVLHLSEISAPVPGDREVLVRVHATSVNFGDTMVRNFRAVTPRQFHMPMLFWLIGRAQFGFRKPRAHVLGSDFAGQVAAVGPKVTRFEVGDRVFGFRGARMGAYAEYLCAPERGAMTQIPETLTYEEAATVPYGAMMAWGLLRKIRLEPQQRVLVIGASGGIGPALVQLAVSQFDAEVTGVCSTPNVDYVRSLGATDVVDYTTHDFLESNETYDVIIDILGKSSFADCKHTLAARGKLIYVSFKMREIGQMLWTSISSSRKVRCVVIDEKAEDLEAIAAFINAGKLRPLVGKTFPLEQAAEAHRHAASEAKTGPIVITIPELGTHKATSVPA